MGCCIWYPQVNSTNEDDGPLLLCWGCYGCYGFCVVRVVLVGVVRVVTVVLVLFGLFVGDKFCVICESSLCNVETSMLWFFPVVVVVSWVHVPHRWCG